MAKTSSSVRWMNEHLKDEFVKKAQKGCNGRSTKCITHNLWDELELHINTFFEKKNLSDLIKNNFETII